MTIMRFRAKAKSENSTKVVVEARGFKIIIDEPEDLGGNNTGPNPVEYVLAALSGCLNVVGHLVAKEMGFELRGLEISLSGDLDPAKFSGEPTENRTGYTVVRATVNADTDADRVILEKWLAAVEDRCPVSDNLAHVTPLEIVLGNQG